MNWTGKKVLITGGSGFVGKHLVNKLLSVGADIRIADINIELALSFPAFDADLMRLDDCLEVCKDQEVIFNLAGKVGGISHNGSNQGSMFRENAIISLNMLEAARLAGVKKYVCVSSACIYQSNCSIPTHESEGFVGEPDPSNEGYGYAKRVAEVQARTYAQQYGMDIPIVRFYNAYGPGDRFDATGHVIASLIKRAIEGEDPLTVWGTGKPTRSFLFVSDFVDALILAANGFPSATPVNVCDGNEVSIAEIAKLVLKHTNSKAQLVFDALKQDGQPRRLGDITLARSLGFEPKVGIDEGIRLTVEWYRANKD